ncbi:LisH domain-containing protein [Caenorhabditis elegans]|uniref:LisH domain-containing protein n=1 Tax=Caenorhabditis elegans TaxID=6239 RepID=Q9GUN4_CAEEL|nr:LisH domain-containing protein [Caenorhabditis elegans]CCD74091.2 LisH domain-containing protein [Caenorhabditis elegans]|eukprot:NP_500290.2 Uncharacterized protein CELE_Y67D8C.2 [Caenorhabditis elegans]
MSILSNEHTFYLEKLRKEVQETFAEFRGLKIQDGQSFADYCNRIEYLADGSISLGNSRRYIEAMKRLKLRTLISNEYYYVAEAEVCRAPLADHYKVLKNFIISYVRKLEENKELYSAGIVGTCMPDIFRKPLILETPTAITHELTLQWTTVSNVEEQKVMVTDENSTMSEVDTKTLKDLDVIMKKFNLNSISEVEERIQESYRSDDALKKIVQIYEESQKELQELHAKFNAAQHDLRNLELKLQMEQYDHKKAITKYENTPKCSDTSDVQYFENVTDSCEVESSMSFSKSLKDSGIKSYGIDNDHSENYFEREKVDQKAKDTYLGPPLNSNILENFQNCDSMSIVTTECSKTDCETEHETQIIDSPDIDYKNEDTDAIEKETTSIESITIQEKSCDNENDKIEHTMHNSLNNQIQKAGLQKPGDVACGGFFDKKMKRRVNEEMRPRTDPPTDLSQQACYGTVSDILDWNNWSHDNWKDMSWQRFVRESRPRKDPPWSSCRSEADMCYGWRWDVSQVPSCSQDWRSRHVLFTPRQAAEVQ